MNDVLEQTGWLDEGWRVYLDLDVYSLAAGASKRLVDHDACIGHAVALALGARAQQERPHGRRQTKAVCLHFRSAQLQRNANASLPRCS